MDKNTLAKLWPVGWEVVYDHETHTWSLEDWTVVPHRVIISSTQISLWRLLRAAGINTRGIKQ